MKRYYVSVNGKRYEVEVEEVLGEFERKSVQTVHPQAAFDNAEERTFVSMKKENKETQISAGFKDVSGEKIECPMPGTIIDINVKEGEKVKKGHVLMVLEAMKMENEIMAPRDSEIISIGVTKGAPVNTGDVLLYIK